MGVPTSVRAALAAAVAWAVCNGPARVDAATEPAMDCSAWATGSKLMSDKDGCCATSSRTLLWPASAYKTTLGTSYATRAKMEQGVSGRRDSCKYACKKDVHCTAAWHNTAEPTAGVWASTCYLFSLAGVLSHGKSDGMCDDIHDACMIKTGTGCKAMPKRPNCGRRGLGGSRTGTRGCAQGNGACQVPSWGSTPNKCEGFCASALFDVKAEAYYCDTNGYNCPRDTTKPQQSVCDVRFDCSGWDARGQGGQLAWKTFQGFCKGPNTIAYDNVKITTGSNHISRGSSCRIGCEKDERCTGAYYDASNNVCHLFDVDTKGWTGGKANNEFLQCFTKQFCKAKYRYKILTGDDPNAQRCMDMLGGSPVIGLPDCEYAASKAHIGHGDTSATNYASQFNAHDNKAPEGCFVQKVRGYPVPSLYASCSPTQKGHGVISLTNIVRQPICRIDLVKEGCQHVSAFAKVGDGVCDCKQGSCAEGTEYAEFSPSTRMTPQVCALGCLKNPLCTSYELGVLSMSRFTCHLWIGRTCSTTQSTGWRTGGGNWGAVSAQTFTMEPACDDRRSQYEAIGSAACTGEARGFVSSSLECKQAAGALGILLSGITETAATSSPHGCYASSPLPPSGSRRLFYNTGTTYTKKPLKNQLVICIRRPSPATTTKAATTKVTTKVTTKMTAKLTTISATMPVTQTKTKERTTKPDTPATTAPKQTRATALTPPPPSCSGVDAFTKVGDGVCEYTPGGYTQGTDWDNYYPSAAMTNQECALGCLRNLNCTGYEHEEDNDDCDLWFGSKCSTIEADGWRMSLVARTYAIRQACRAHSTDPAPPPPTNPSPTPEAASPGSSTDSPPPSAQGTATRSTNTTGSVVQDGAPSTPEDDTSTLLATTPTATKAAAVDGGGGGDDEGGSDVVLPIMIALVVFVCCIGVVVAVMKQRRNQQAQKVLGELATERRATLAQQAERERDSSTVVNETFDASGYLHVNSTGDGNGPARARSTGAKNVTLTANVLYASGDTPVVKRTPNVLYASADGDDDDSGGKGAVGKAPENCADMVLRQSQAQAQDAHLPKKGLPTYAIEGEGAHNPGMPVYAVPVAKSVRGNAGGVVLMQGRKGVTGEPQAVQYDEACANAVTSTGRHAAGVSYEVVGDEDGDHGLVTPIAGPNSGVVRDGSHASDTAHETMKGGGLSLARGQAQGSRLAFGNSSA